MHNNVFIRATIYQIRKRSFPSFILSPISVAMVAYYWSESHTQTHTDQKKSNNGNSSLLLLF